MTPTPKVPPTLAYLRAMRDDILGLAHAYGAYDVRVFGSVARGEATLDSDVDLLVDFRPDAKIGFFELADMEIKLSQLIGWRVDLRTPQELSRYFRQEVLQNARLLDEKDF
jgi:predicted nucleotidyltransferase